MKVPEEQVVYAKILYYGSLVGIIFMAVTFAIYVSGIVSAYVPKEKLVELWTEKTHVFVEETNMPTGWEWVDYVSYADILNYVPLAFLAMLTVICYLAIIPALARKKDAIYLVLAVAEIAILLLAASGILQAGH